jgi:hypothetical protein
MNQANPAPVTAPETPAQPRVWLPDQLMLYLFLVLFVLFSAFLLGDLVLGLLR